MNKIMLFSLIIASSYSNNSLGMLFLRKTARIQQIRSFAVRFHYVGPTHFEQVEQIQNEYEKLLLKNPDFLKKVENQQLREIKDLLHALLKQNHLHFKINNREINKIPVDGRYRGELEELNKKFNLLDL